LRIYQSLLTNSGRNEPGQSRSAESDAAVVQQQQPHHRQNNFWRNRNKEKTKATPSSPKSNDTIPAMVDDVELSSVAAEFEANGQDLRSPSDTTSAPPAAAKSSVAPSNVEFRHSRVKTSPENTGPLSVDQKIWSRSNGIFSIGAGPYASGASLQEGRISAATAPAILTKTVTANAKTVTANERHFAADPLWSSRKCYETLIVTVFGVFSFFFCTRRTYCYYCESNNTFPIIISNIYEEVPVRRQDLPR
jgi:hypothetical protein